MAALHCLYCYAVALNAVQLCLMLQLCASNHQARHTIHFWHTTTQLTFLSEFQREALPAMTILPPSTVSVMAPGAGTVFWAKQVLSQLSTFCEGVGLGIVGSHLALPFRKAHPGQV